MGAKSNLDVAPQDLLHRAGRPAFVRPQRRGGNSQVGQVKYLILNQRYERRDDDRDTLGQNRGELVAQALAAACGHEHEHVPLRHRRVNYGLLMQPE